MGQGTWSHRPTAKTQQSALFDFVLCSSTAASSHLHPHRRTHTREPPPPGHVRHDHRAAPTQRRRCVSPASVFLTSQIRVARVFSSYSIANLGTQRGAPPMARLLPAAGCSAGPRAVLAALEGGCSLRTGEPPSPTCASAASPHKWPWRAWPSASRAPSAPPPASPPSSHTHIQSGGGGGGLVVVHLCLGGC